MADLKITDGILDELESGLKSIIDQLRDSTQFSDDIGDLVGHDDLAGKVHQFGSKWSVHRGKMIDGTTGIHDAVAMIDKTFGDVDKQLAQAFDETPDSGHTKGNSHGPQ